jgi:protein CpxP
VTPMNTRSTIISVSLMLGIGIASAGSAIAQGMMGGTGQGMMGPGMMQGDTNQGMMGRGTMQGSGGSMMCPMMGGMMQGGQSMMGSGIMGPI